MSHCGYRDRCISPARCDEAQTCTHPYSDQPPSPDLRERVARAPAPTVSKPNGHPADGMTMHVPVGESAFMEIADPRSFKNGGPEWTMRYGNPESIRFTVASLLGSYDYLLSHEITLGEATRRLRVMRAYRLSAHQDKEPGR